MFWFLPPGQPQTHKSWVSKLKKLLDEDFLLTMVWCFDDKVVTSLRAAIHSQDTQMYRHYFSSPHLICLMSPHLIERELRRKGNNLSIRHLGLPAFQLHLTNKYSVTSLKWPFLHSPPSRYLGEGSVLSLAIYCFPNPSPSHNEPGLQGWAHPLCQGFLNFLDKSNWAPA